MKNSVSEQSLYTEESDGEVGNEEEIVNADNESDKSDYEESSFWSRQQSRAGSYNTTWPQSYRQSIDMYSSVTPPTIGFLQGTPSLSRLGSSFLISSFQGRHAAPEITKPLLPTTTSITEHIQPQRSSHALLPPPVPKRSSFLKPKDGAQKPSTSVISHEMPTAPHECSFGQAVINGINVLCGVGILSTPNAVKQGGWLGLLILLLFGVLAFYTGILLRRCLDSEQGLETYPDIGQAAFGTKGRVVVSIILYLELYACCVEYLILESDNLSSLFPNAHVNIGGAHINANLLFAIVTTLIVLPTTWVRDLSILSYISAGGVVASILVVLSLFWVGLVDQIGFKNEGTALNLPGLPIAIGLYGYCYSGHGVFPNIYTSLKKPNQYSSVLFTSFFICTVMFGGVAAMGYAMFGEATLSQFTLNMPQTFMASKVAVWTTVVNPLTKYAITLMPMALSLEELLPANKMKSHMYSIGIRTALVVSTLLVALSVPFFGLVMALIGSLLTMLVALIIPCLCYLSILKGKVTWIQVTLCTIVITVGIFSALVGSYSALSQILQRLS